MQVMPASALTARCDWNETARTAVLEATPKQQLEILPEAEQPPASASFTVQSLEAELAAVMQQMAEERVRVAGTWWGDAADDRGEGESGGHYMG